MSGNKAKFEKGKAKVKQRKHHRGLLGVAQDLVGALLGNPDIRGER